MVAITLPDGSQRHYEKAITGATLAQDIGSGLAKSALAVRISGVLKDLNSLIETDSYVEIITKKNAEALELLRHDAAHVMAEAVKELYPDTQVTIGPAIENGYYYDFARSTPFTPDDLIKIEERMHEIVKRDEVIIREEWERDKAILFFKNLGETYKAEIIESIPRGEPIGLYRQGDFIDLCRGPHLPSTAKLGHAFKLMKVAGAYWRGDSRNEMLQRIYGTVWFEEKDLQSYLTMLEEAEKRDHRRLGREMGLFHQQEEAVGSVFWHPKGWQLWRTVENYIRHRLENENYVEVKTPQLVDRSLWELSGHWEKFGDNMFTVQTPDDKTLAIKPMNCPCHVQIFKTGIKSYRDLPLRMAEFGSCHRYEPSGAMHGIMRVRAFTQDDAHIFCTEDQITPETIRFCNLLKEVYMDFGFTDLHVKFSDRPATRAGTDEIWDKSEKALLDAAHAANISVSHNPGEGAFYGPKLEFVLRDAIGRHWQCGTLQVDFVLPERLDASYIDVEGTKKRPVMLHRAILGSFERFLGILIEHHAGRFPLWLSPVQIVVATITSEANDYAHSVLKAVKAAGLRAELDLRNEKINFKIREHSIAKVPEIMVIGKREAELNQVSLRTLGGNDQETLALDEAIVKLVSKGAIPSSQFS